MPRTLEGGFADPAVDAALAFRAALTALSHPGSVQRVAGAAPPSPLSPAGGVLLLALCDHETGIWLAPSVDRPAVRDWLRFHTGAPFAARSEAAFGVGRWEELVPLADFRQGTPDYPDRSATLIIERDDIGERHRLTGPGIENEGRLTVPDPDALRANAAAFPLGLDFFLTADDRLVGLPRTTRIGGQACT